MSTMTAAFQPTTASGPKAPELRPWGFWASLGWGLLSVVTALFAVVAYSMFWAIMHQLHLPTGADPAFSISASIMAAVAPMIVLVVAVKERRYALIDYFSLNRVPQRELALGITGLVGLIVLFEIMERLFDIDTGSKYVASTYREAKLAGMLPLLWLAVVIVAPITEELTFRGFLHRGWAPSWLGVPGTILLTSILWAAMHQQYNWWGILCIFLMGIYFGWIRHRAQSTTLTIALHALNNALATLLVAI